MSSRRTPPRVGVGSMSNADDVEPIPHPVAPANGLACPTLLNRRHCRDRLPCDAGKACLCGPLKWAIYPEEFKNFKESIQNSSEGNCR
jgi:hypothetical protein